LLFFLGVAANERGVTVGIVVLSTGDVLLSLLGGEGVGLGVTWPFLVGGGTFGNLAVKFLLLFLIAALGHDLERVVVGRVGGQGTRTLLFLVVEVFFIG
jgi:hypothetical protein